MQIEITHEYLQSQGLSDTFPERFWCKVIKTDSCWIWIGSLNDAGYGQISRGGRMGPIRSHIASWIIHNGPVPEGQCVLHNCPKVHIRRCINPDHLKLGDRADNWRDAIRMGTAPKFPIMFGERARTARLTWKIVDEIRHSGGVARQIARQFGVSPSCIERVLNHSTWKLKYHPSTDCG